MQSRKDKIYFDKPEMLIKLGCFENLFPSETIEFDNELKQFILKKYFNLKIGIFKNIKKCKNKNLHLIYDFGLMPHVNNYKLKDDKGSVPKYPLRLMYCDNSKLLRLDSMPDRENIYRDYDHLSSASSANAKHLESIAENINDSESTDKIILEVGCNDATLLRRLNNNFNIFGIDPASNVYRHEKKINSNYP